MIRKIKSQTETDSKPTWCQSHVNVRLRQTYTD